MRWGNLVLYALNRCLRKTPRTSSSSSQTSRRRLARQRRSSKLLRKSAMIRQSSSAQSMTNVPLCKAKSIKSSKSWTLITVTKYSLTTYGQMMSRKEMQKFARRNSRPKKIEKSKTDSMITTKGGELVSRTQVSLSRHKPESLMPHKQACKLKSGKKKLNSKSNILLSFSRSFLRTVATRSTSCHSISLPT